MIERDFDVPFVAQLAQREKQIQQHYRPVIGVRREDMRKLLEATQGKVFTLKTLDHLIENTALQAFRSR